MGKNLDSVFEGVFFENDDSPEGNPLRPAFWRAGLEDMRTLTYPSVQQTFFLFVGLQVLIIVLAGVVAVFDGVMKNGMVSLISGKAFEFSVAGDSIADPISTMLR